MSDNLVAVVTGANRPTGSMPAVRKRQRYRYHHPEHLDRRHLGGLVGGALAALAMDRLSGRVRGVAAPIAACLAIGVAAAVASVAIAG